MELLFITSIISGYLGSMERFPPCLQGVLVLSLPLMGPVQRTSKPKPPPSLSEGAGTYVSISGPDPKWMLDRWAALH